MATYKPTFLFLNPQAIEYYNKNNINNRDKAICMAIINKNLDKLKHKAGMHDLEDIFFEEYIRFFLPHLKHLSLDKLNFSLEYYIFENTKESNP
jgi:alpha-amylase/alpha-mannosidase (GH57 family)